MAEARVLQMAPFLSHQGDCHSADHGQACSAQPTVARGATPPACKTACPYTGLVMARVPGMGRCVSGLE